MQENDYLDPDDIRRRGAIDLHPVFYWRCIYNPEKKIYDLVPFMRINNGDGTHADYMDVAVSQKHTVRYKDVWQRFRTAQDPKRTEYTRAELMHVPPFRDRFEYHKTMILLPASDPDYEELISDFSVRLNPEDIATLNRIDDTEQEMDAPLPIKDDTRSQSQRILDVLGKVADTLENLDERIRKLEQQTQQ